MDVSVEELVAGLVDGRLAAVMIVLSNEEGPYENWKSEILSPETWMLRLGESWKTACPTPDEVANFADEVASSVAKARSFFLTSVLAPHAEYIPATGDTLITHNIDIIHPLGTNVKTADCAGLLTAMVMRKK